MFFSLYDGFCLLFFSFIKLSVIKSLWKRWNNFCVIVIKAYVQLYTSTHINRQTTALFISSDLFQNNKNPILYPQLSRSQDVPIFAFHFPLLISNRLLHNYATTCLTTFSVLITNTLCEQNFHSNLNFAISLMANSLNLNSACNYFFWNLSIIVYIIEFQKSIIVYI